MPPRQAAFATPHRQVHRHILLHTPLPSPYCHTCVLPPCLGFRPACSSSCRSCCVRRSTSGSRGLLPCQDRATRVRAGTSLISTLGFTVAQGVGFTGSGAKTLTRQLTRHARPITRVRVVLAVPAPSGRPRATCSVSAPLADPPGFGSVSFVYSLGMMKDTCVRAGATTAGGIKFAVPTCRGQLLPHAHATQQSSQPTLSHPLTLYSPAPISAVTGLVIAILALAGAPLISRVTWQAGRAGGGRGAELVFRL